MRGVGVTGRQQWAVVGTVVAALLGGALVAAHSFADDLFPVSVGSRAPDFRAVTVAGSPTMKTLADYKGEAIFLNVWATYCGPCRVEMPSMEQLHREYGPRGLRIVAVSIDDAGAVERVRAFAQEFGLTFEILHDPTGAIQRSYQTIGVPESFIIGRDGVIRKKVIGASDWSSPASRALVTTLLEESRPASTVPAAR
ncbi:MAG: hypothetical protein NVS1B4_00190 [Gemmatimonadaceae bacterium]